MSQLTDRYLYVLSRRLPSNQREETVTELSELISEQVDNRIIERNQSPQEAERDVLNELGNPDLLAEKYSGRVRALIGPALFPLWRLLMTILNLIAVPVIVIISGISAATQGEDFASIIGTVLTTAITLIINFSFWVTLVFAIMESRDYGSDLEATPPDDWSVDDLPELPTNPTDKSELIGEVVTSALFIGFLAFQTWTMTETTTIEPWLNPEIALPWIPILIAVAAINALVSINCYVKQRVSMAAAVTYLVASLVAVISITYLAMTNLLLNPALISDEGWTSQTNQITNVVIVIVAVVAWGYDSIRLLVAAWRNKPS